MSNVVRFRGGPDGELGARRHSGATFLAEPPPSSHAVQFYEDEAFLADTVAQFLDAGLRAGEHVAVIASKEHRDAFLERLGRERIRLAAQSGHLTCVDAHEMLSTFMVGSLPDAGLFRSAVSRLLEKVTRGDGSLRVRLYGEMVDILWKEGKSTAAVRLEELWNDAGKDRSFSLLCAYVMGHFAREGDATHFTQVCAKHSHVMPTENYLGTDDHRASLREISLLQQRARALEDEIRKRKDLERALREALREQTQAEDELRACVQREREAREQAEASDAFKEVFLGILGHDLRNPLNTILTTARLMTMRREVGPDSQKRLDRMVVSGERMQRMIEQLLDLTRARLAGGIPLVRTDAVNLVPLVTKIVDEIRVAGLGCAIDLEVEGQCTARVDADRFEQVVSNLVGNAVAHGDPARSIRVLLAARPGATRLTVHNFGRPVDPEFIPLLFNPFARGGHLQARSDGLGLGLYIAERIVSAHGEARSAIDRGGGNALRRDLSQGMSGVRGHEAGCVLIVDDEEGIRDTLCEVVEMGGCEAIAAANGAEAMQLLSAHRPCLIILDLMMPIMTGVEMLDAMRKDPALAEIPVVISTSAPSRAPPGLPVLPKPIHIAAVWDWMRRNCACREVDPAAGSGPRSGG